VDVGVVLVPADPVARLGGFHDAAGVPDDPTGELEESRQEGRAGLVRQRDGVLGLPMIVNEKTVDPGDPSSPKVIQLETAMGAAIGVFDGAAAIRVPRERFTPVKTTNDLLLLRSDAYELGDDWRVSLVAEQIPLIDLDSDYFKLLRDFDERFTDGPPSLVAARRLEVIGDVAFGRDVTVRGEVTVENDDGEQLKIEDGTVLEG